MRIRYVLFNAYGVGGTVRSVVNQANALCGEHDVEIASVYRTREKPAFAIDPRVRLVPLTRRRSRRRRRRQLTRLVPNPLPHRHDFRFRRWDPAVDLKLVRYFRSAGGGILVTTRPGLTLLAARTAPRRLVRVAQDHRSYPSYSPSERDALVRAYRRLDAVTVLTEQDRASYQQALAGWGTRLECIPNGIPRPRRPPARSRLKIIIAAGRLEHEKGFDLLLDAFQTVAATYPDWRLRIYGAGREKRDLAAQIERLGLSGRVRLRGTSRNLDRRFAAASIFVLSSRQEGLPMVLLEAMGAGLPVVAFDCATGPAELITPGRNGLLVPAEDVAALAAGMCELIEDRPRRRAMGAAARRDSRRYSIVAVRRRWQELFSDLTRARSVRGGG
jgi:glycosyltransferase involved in cell wall biosynthesis